MVPQDSNYGGPMAQGINPKHPTRKPPYVQGAHMHRAYERQRDGSIFGSKGCPMQLGFDDPPMGPGDKGGLGHHLYHSPTGRNGRALILREQ